LTKKQNHLCYHRCDFGSSIFVDYNQKITFFCAPLSLKKYCMESKYSYFLMINPESIYLSFLRINIFKYLIINLLK